MDQGGLGRNKISIENISANEVKKLAGSLKKILLFMALLFVTFVSGFGAMGSYIFHWQEARFYQTAIEAEGRVEAVREGISRTTQTRDHRTETRTETHYTAHIEYSDQSGRMQRATISMGGYPTHQEGDQIRVAYNPSNPSEVRWARTADSVPTLLKVSQVLGGVFALSLLILFWIHTQSRGPG